MAAIPAIVALLQEVLNGSGVFKARRMFGGHGLYLDGQFFAILDDDRLYFKVSDATRSAYEAEGMGPFTYQSKSGEHALNSYWRVPERLYDEPEEMRDWVRSAVGAARASVTQEIRKRKRKSPAHKGKGVVSKPAAEDFGHMRKTPRPGKARKTTS